MPICTTCTQFTPYLYTVYQSATNLRLEQCSKCQTFADPYVEHDTLTLFLDLILLKRGVFRHLLYNRGTEPRKAEPAAEEKRNAGSRPQRSREKERWLLVVRLGGTLLALDAFIRWSYFSHNISPWTKESFESALRVFLGCFAETIAFHTGVIVACSAMLRIISWTQSQKFQKQPVSDIKREFRLSLIPLTLLYSSLTKLFLLFLLTIWRPTNASISDSHPVPRSGASSFLFEIFKILDDEHIDREWVIRNALGGMSAGFGLRVVLDIHPLLSSMIILSGWLAKIAITALISEWVGGNEMAGQAWKAYSIP